MKITIADFRANEALQSSYQHTIKTPEFQHGLDAIRNDYAPVAMVPPAGVDYSVWNSHQNARREGFFEALAMIELLAVPVIKREDKPDRRLMPSLVDEESYVEPNTQ